MDAALMIEGQNGRTGRAGNVSLPSLKSPVLPVSTAPITLPILNHPIKMRWSSGPH